MDLYSSQMEGYRGNHCLGESSKQRSKIRAVIFGPKYAIGNFIWDRYIIALYFASVAFRNKY